MQWLESIPRFNLAAALQKQRLLPAPPVVPKGPVGCCHCAYVNPSNHHYCTQCGYPMDCSKETFDRYYLRLQVRRKLQRNCLVRIEHARNALYVLAACSMIGIFYVFSASRQTAVTGFVMLLLGIIYGGLGRWSLTRPFTALLISLILLVTFTLINTWAEMASAFRASGSLYLLLIQMILIHFLLRGVTGAFRADLLEEELKV